MKKLYLPLLLILPFALLTGCLEREETMTIRADGSIASTIVLDGDKNDILSGLAVPRTGTWRVEQRPYKKSDGKMSYRYRAQGSFSNLESYSRALDHGPRDLRIDQSLKVERQGRKTFYRYRRVYRARDWKKYEELKKKELDKYQKDLKKGLENLSPQRQKKVLAHLLNFEVKKRLFQIRDALGRALADGADFPSQMIEQALREVEKGIRKTFPARRLRELLALLKTNPQQLEVDLKALAKELEKAEEDALQKVFVSYPQVDFRKYRQEVRKEFQLTEDLLDENFKLHLTMPGRIILTNGRRVGANQVKWKFGGKELAGRQVLIEVVSVVEK